MKTEQLIEMLAADNSRRNPAMDRILFLGLVAAVTAAGLLLFSTMGVRSDFVAAMTTLRFPFKFVVTLALVSTAVVVFRQTLFPVASHRPHFSWFLLAPAILALGVIAELATIPSASWFAMAQGENALLCLTVIPALGLVPLALMLWVLRQGAPTRPLLGGLFAGIVAGAIAATFYAANCTDDSPLFVATWYPLAILGLGVVGSILGPALARW